MNPALLARIRAVDLLLSWAGACPRVPSQATPCSTSPRRKIPLVHVHLTPMNSAACTRRSFVNATPTAFCAALPTQAAQALQPERQQAVQARHAAYLARATRRRSASPATCRWAR